jgi:DNA ligase-1
MLATDADLTKLRFPLLASAKLDGIRAVVRDGVVYSRSNKPIPNKYVQRLFADFEHFDGELIVGDPCSKTVYRDTVSHVMSNDKEGFHVNFFVFDSVRDLSADYRERLRWLAEASENNIGIVLHEQVEMRSLDELLEYEEECLEDGYEGLILRDASAPYKNGRSTVKEGYLLKLKRFQDAEATVVGFEERMHNGNEATTNELGRTRRSSHQAGKSGRGDLGALVCRTSEGIEFNIGTGFTDSERERVWLDRDQFLGRLAKFKFFPVGVKEAPRHPVFLGWRDGSDL